MTVQEIYQTAIELGIKNDLRGAEAVHRNLMRLKQEYEKLDEQKKQRFDVERLANPFSDTRIHYDSRRPVKKALCGIDVEAAELLLAKQAGDIDLVIAHHPIGRGLARLHEVMDLQAEVLADYGVPINVAQGLLKLRIDEVARTVGPCNHYRAVDAAKLLDMSLINVHTPADNLVALFLRRELESRKFTFVSEILETLREIPEYAAAAELGFGPCLFAGSETNYCGKIAITEITGGTEGSPDMYEKLSQAGIGTIIGMHMSEKHKEAAEKNHINAIIAGHMSSDSLGMNLFLDELEKRGVQIAAFSGLLRVSRAVGGR